MDIKTYISSGVIEAYALGNLSPEESSILECVMANNVEVKSAVLEMQQTFEKLATVQAITPPAYLKAEILKKIDLGTAENRPAKIIPLNTDKANKTSTNSIPLWMKVASVVLLFGLGYMGYELGSKSAQIEKIAQNNTALSTKVSSLEQMNSVLMNSKKIELKGVEKHPNMLAEVYWNESNEVFLNPKNLPAPPAGKQYQLWAIVDGKPVDMGMYDSTNSAVIQEMKTVTTPQAFAITLEKAGGNESPTMEEMVVMGTI